VQSPDFFAIDLSKDQWRLELLVLADVTQLIRRALHHNRAKQPIER
jgi:hypothetical protein